MTRRRPSRWPRPRFKTAELDLSFSTIAAPISGRTGRTLVTAGNWVSAGAASGATLLTTIVSHDPIYIYFDVRRGVHAAPERLATMGRLPLGTPARRGCAFFEISGG